MITSKNKIKWIAMWMSSQVFRRESGLGFDIGSRVKVGTQGRISERDWGRVSGRGSSSSFGVGVEVGVKF